MPVWSNQPAIWNGWEFRSFAAMMTGCERIGERPMEMQSFREWQTTGNSISASKCFVESKLREVWRTFVMGSIRNVVRKL